MPNEQHYNRLQGIRIGVKIRQGDYVYVPSDNMINQINFTDSSELSDFIEYLYDNYNALDIKSGRIYAWNAGAKTYLIVFSVDYEMATIIGGQGDAYNVYIGERVFKKLEQMVQKGNYDTVEDFLNDHSYGDIEHATVGYSQQLLRVGDFVVGGDFGIGHWDGSTLTQAIMTNAVNALYANEAEKDSSGRKIESTYLKRVEIAPPIPNAENINIAYINKSGNDTTTFSNGITLEKVTTSKAGVMTASDKTNLDGLLSGSVVAKKAELDDDGNTIKRTYLNKLNKIEIIPSPSSVSINVEATRPAGNFQNPPFSSVNEDIPAATTIVAGVMSATDKSRLDQLWAVLQDSSDPTFVDTINEILAIFSNYPEGMDIIAKFAEKVDKTTTINNHALNDDVRLTADDIFVENASHYYDSQEVDEAIEDLHQTKAEKSEVFTREEVIGLLENYETGVNGSKIYYNETIPSELTENDLWFHLLGE